MDGVRDPPSMCVSRTPTRSSPRSTYSAGLSPPATPQAADDHLARAAGRRPPGLGQQHLSSAPRRRTATPLPRSLRLWARTRGRYLDRSRPAGLRLVRIDWRGAVANNDLVPAGVFEALGDVTLDVLGPARRQHPWLSHQHHSRRRRGRLDAGRRRAVHAPIRHRDADLRQPPRCKRRRRLPLGAVLPNLGEPPARRTSRSWSATPAPLAEGRESHETAGAGRCEAGIGRGRVHGARGRSGRLGPVLRRRGGRPAPGAVEALDAAGILAGTGCTSDRLCPKEPLPRWAMAVCCAGPGRARPAALGRLALRRRRVLAMVGAPRGASRRSGRHQGVQDRPARFCPDRPVTRAQTARLPAAGLPAQPGPVIGVHRHAGQHPRSAIDALAEARITVGCSGAPAPVLPECALARAQDGVAGSSGPAVQRHRHVALRG